MTSEKMIDDETKKKIDELFDGFKKRIRTSHNLAEETEEFITETQKILTEEFITETQKILNGLFDQENLQIAEIIQGILDYEPDANLRRKFGRLAEIIKSENGKLTKTQIETGLIGR